MSLVQDVSIQNQDRRFVERHARDEIVLSIQRSFEDLLPDGFARPNLMLDAELAEFSRLRIARAIDLPPFYGNLSRLERESGSILREIGDNDPASAERFTGYILPLVASTIKAFSTETAYVEFRVDRAFSRRLRWHLDGPYSGGRDQDSGPIDRKLIVVPIGLPTFLHRASVETRQAYDKIWHANIPEEEKERKINELIESERQSNPDTIPPKLGASHGVLLQAGRPVTGVAGMHSEPQIDGTVAARPRFYIQIIPSPHAKLKSLLKR